MEEIVDEDEHNIWSGLGAYPSYSYHTSCETGGYLLGQRDISNMVFADVEGFDL
jgi:hypothetical protein